VAVTIGDLHQRFLASAGACIDTRQLVAGGMFFALKGPNFDANAFAGAALASGCRHAVVDDPARAPDDRFILVTDVLRALQELARHHRRSFDIPVIAITGTNGKTTTKELVHAVLSADRPALATPGNLNNHIGVPLTLLQLKPEHRIAVVEMGANHVGEIAALCTIAEPTHGLITNIGHAHLEGFGSYEGVIQAKTELYGHIREHGGKLFVNADDRLLMKKSEGTDRITYGTVTGSDLHGRLEARGMFLGLQWQWEGSASAAVHTRLIGSYNLPNALAAACIGSTFHVPIRMIENAIAGYDPGNSRSQFVDTGRNQLVLDAYNANPSSMRAALENFAAMATDRPKLVVLGGMKELGAHSAAEHRALIALAGRLKVEAVFVGPEFAGLTGGLAHHADSDAAFAALRERPVRGKLVLLKGSRGTQLEKLLPAL